MEDIIITTGETIPGYTISKIIEIISVHDDRLRPATLLENSQEYVMELLKKKALKKGADAVIGIQFQYHDSLRMILMGTLVKTSRNKE